MLRTKHYQVFKTGSDHYLIQQRIYRTVYQHYKNEQVWKENTELIFTLYLNIICGFSVFLISRKHFATDG